MLKKLLVWSGMTLVGYAAVPALPSPTSSQSASRITQSASRSRAILDSYCVACHNQKSATAGLMLDRIDPEKVSENAPVWEKVVHKLRTRTMPPPGRTRPDAASYNALIAHLEDDLDRASVANPNPGRPAIHRLNRAEYANAIRDLLA